MDFKKDPAVYGQLDTAKDDILKKLKGALEDAGLDDFHVGSIGLYYRQPPKKCGPDEDLVWEPIATGDDDLVTYGWVCKPRTK